MARDSTRVRRGRSICEPRARPSAPTAWPPRHQKEPAMRRVFVVMGFVAVAACQAATADDVGMIALAIAEAPAGTACLRGAVTGATGGAVSRTVGLTPGAATMQTLGGIPVGASTVHADAFDVACASLT